MNNYLSTLVQELTTRSARAVLSKFSPASDPLRTYLRKEFERPAGEAGSFLADPVIEAAFGWELASGSLGSYAGSLIHPEVVRSMDEVPAPLREFQFPRDRFPYTHQVESWTRLKEEGRSILVSSGTSSGKTECFLVPILDDLARESQKVGRLTGVRALFLYPLNALIASQRDRLLAWTAGFEGRIRSCLYNGETPESVPAHQQNAEPVLVLSRKELRRDPPPILVTNGSMLEYMLVRSSDQPIIAASQGKLRWIVLDEAHTYLGTSAADIALLIRRVLHAFSVDPSEVHFVATSATISAVGGKDGSSELRRFLSDVAGTPESNVTVIEGRRFAPPLPAGLETVEGPLPRVEELANLSAAERFETLTKLARVRSLRKVLTERGPQLLGTLAGQIFDKGPHELTVSDRRSALDYLDLIHTAVSSDQVPLLPIRFHVFQRTQRGLWCCASSRCPGRAGTPLDSRSWPWGKVFLERRIRCDQEGCESLVFDLVLCAECGADFLSAREGIASGARTLEPNPSELENEQEGELDEPLMDPEDDEEDDTAPAEDGVEREKKFPRLLDAHKDEHIPPAAWNWTTGAIDPPDPTGHVTVVVHQAASRFRCPRCGTTERKTGDLFRPARAGAPFLLGLSLPTLLELSAPPEDGEGNSRPMNGRRILTFSDSRQGTARFALKTQVDAERNYVRSLVYHIVASRPTNPDPAELARLEGEIGELRKVAGRTPILVGMLRDKEKELAQKRNPAPPSVAWLDVEAEIQHREESKKWMPKSWRHLPLATATEGQIGSFLLFREFLRRPKRQFSLETLGLISLRFPAMDGLSQESLPATWRAKGRSVEEWREFLHVLMNYFIRARGAVRVDPQFLRWMGSPAPVRSVVGPDGMVANRLRQVRWPEFNANRLTQIPRLLISFLDLEIPDPQTGPIVDELLRDAWRRLSLCGLLTIGQDGAQVDLRSQVHLTIISDAWLCPVTRRILDVALGGRTPFQVPRGSADLSRCRKVRMPKHPYPFMRTLEGGTVPEREVREWLEWDPEVVQLRADGAWTEFTDRVFLFQHYFRAAEHSAQMPPGRLRCLEKEFKNGSVNLLSSSTTMEMGVDIGGLSSVGMTNVPPAPANFLQRAGRAGRRGELVSTTLTVCPGVPHSETVFRTPLWPFVTAVRTPYVSLDSRRLVQRHVNAMALRSFLQAAPGSATTLTAGWFFGSVGAAGTAPVDSFSQSLATDAVSTPPDLQAGVERVVRRTCLEGIPARRLLATTSEAVDGIALRYREERQALEDQVSSLGPVGTESEPVLKALKFQIQRLEEEFLLKDLTARGFLPGHGFPTDIVPFVNSTWESIKAAKKADTSDRDDVAYSRRGFPSRDAALALREYAPGAEVVVDGQVFSSGGLALIWKIPANDESAREIQSFQIAWRCNACGACGVWSSMFADCPACGAVLEKFRPFIHPGGFAVDIGYETHNDVSHRRYIPVREPWISVGGEDWTSLPDPAIGRWRYSPEGLVFAHSLGEREQGYAICLQCGRASSESGKASEGAPLPPDLDDPPGAGHLRLRGGKGPDGSHLCGALASSWGIKRNQALGVPNSTDVFELQLKDARTGFGIPDRETAFSLAVALGRALAERLGVDDREIGCTRIPSRGPHRESTWSIVLFDTAPGGAGFVGGVPTDLAQLLRNARGILDCPRRCDRACHACLLTYASQHQIGMLNRQKALAFLSEDLLARLVLPEEHRVLGATSVFEPDSVLVAASREIGKGDVDEVRLYAGGSSDSWDVAAWNARPKLLNWSARGLKLSLVAPPGVLKGLPVEVGGVLAALAEAAKVKLVESPEKLPGASAEHLIAELYRPGVRVRWGSLDSSIAIPGESWGERGSGVVIVRSEDSSLASALAGSVIASESLRGTPGTHIAADVGSQLDGDLAGFGARFWRLVLQKLPALQSRLGQADIIAVTYRDRFVQSPLVGRLFLEAVRGLVGIGRFSPETAGIRLTTVSGSSRFSAIPAVASDDWNHATNRRQVLERALGTVAKSVTIELKSRNEVPHQRELRVVWADGTTWHASLDQGFGFLDASQQQPFPFDRPVKDQVAALLNMAGSLKAVGRTVFYLQRIG